MKLCSVCQQDCTHDGEFMIAWELKRGPGPFQFSMQLVAPPDSIVEEAVCRPCVWDMSDG